MNWAQRLKRVFRIEIERFARCGGAVRLIAAIEDRVPRRRFGCYPPRRGAGNDVQKVSEILTLHPIVVPVYVKRSADVK